MRRYRPTTPSRRAHPDIERINPDIETDSLDTITYHVGDATAYISGNPKFDFVKLVGRRESEAVNRAKMLLEHIGGTDLTEIK